MFGALPAESIKQGESAPVHLTENMQLVVDLIKKLRTSKKGSGVERDEIFDELQGKIEYDPYIKLLDEMSVKKVLKKFGDTQCYDLA